MLTCGTLVGDDVACGVGVLVGVAGLGLAVGVAAIGSAVFGIAVGSTATVAVGFEMMAGTVFVATSEDSLPQAIITRQSIAVASMDFFVLSIFF